MFVVVAKGNLGEMVGRGLPHVVAGSECRDMSAHQRREVHHHSGHCESDCQPCVKSRATRFAPLRSHCDKLRHDKPDAHKGHHSKQRMQTRQGAAHHGEDFVRPCEVKQPEQRMGCFAFSTFLFSGLCSVISPPALLPGRCFALAAT